MHTSLSSAREAAPVDRSPPGAGIGRAVRVVIVRSTGHSGSNEPARTLHIARLSVQRACSVDLRAWPGYRLLSTAFIRMSVLEWRIEHNTTGAAQRQLTRAGMSSREFQVILIVQ